MCLLKMFRTFLYFTTININIGDFDIEEYIKYVAEFMPLIITIN